MPQQVPSNLGGLPRTPDARDFPLGAAQLPVTIPPQYLPDISWFQRNYQGQTPFCGEHAGSHLKALIDFFTLTASPQERKNPRYGAIKMKTPTSPVYDGFPITAGTDMRSIFKWLQVVGADDYEPLENDVTLALATYCDPTVITPAMDQDAAGSQIQSYAFSATDFNSLCQYIFQNKAVLILIKCDNGFWGTTQPTFTNATYGHFIVGYSYDSNGISIVDSADPDDAMAFKYINKKFITPEFFFESGTAVTIPASVQQVLAHPQLSQEQKLSIAQQILTDIAAALTLVQKEI